MNVLTARLGDVDSATKPLLRFRDREFQVLGRIVRIEGREVLQGNGNGAALADLEIEVAADARRHVAHLGAQVAAHLQGELAVLDVAADVAGAADVDEVLDHDIALHRAVDLRGVGLHRAEQPSGLVNEHVAGRDIALDVAVDLELAAIAHFSDATDDGVFRDDEYTLIFGH